MNVSLVAERYAKALFQLALEQHAEEAVYNDSLLLSKTCQENRDLRLLLQSPIVNSGKKLSVIQAIFDKAVSPITLTFLNIMIRKKREALIPAIAQHLGSLYQEWKDILTVHFQSPVTPTAETREQVLQLMKKFTTSEVDLETEIDDSLIGGFILKWNDKQYDASIRREIDNMRNAMAKVNLYKKAY